MNSSLSLIVVLAPLLGVLLVLLVPSRRESIAKWIALGAAAVPAALAVYLYSAFDRTLTVAADNHGMQFIQHSDLIERLHIELHLGVDGVGVAMVLLAALVSLVAVGASWGITKNARGYFALLLLVETGTLGVFCALDLVLFFVCWVMMLLPMCFLVGGWGGPHRRPAARKLFLGTLAGSVLILLIFLALHFKSGPAEHTFDLLKMTYLDAARFEDASLLLFGSSFAKVCWIGLFVGFAILIPIIPDALVEAPTPVAVLLAGVLLKTGTYGILRINFGLLPRTTEWAGSVTTVSGVAIILYGAFRAFTQTDLKKLVAYSSVSLMGYCLVGLGAFTQAGLDGAVMQMFNHGIIAAMLFLLVGAVHDRAHTGDLDKLGGAATQMPILAGFFGFAFLAALGLPGLAGFIGEALVLLGAFPASPLLTMLAAAGLILTAAYHLRAIQRIRLGPRNEAQNPPFPDLSMRERLMLLPMATIVLILGFYPMPLLKLIGPGLNDLLAHVTGHAGAGALASLP